MAVQVEELFWFDGNGECHMNEKKCEQWRRELIEEIRSLKPTREQINRLKARLRENNARLGIPPPSEPPKTALPIEMSFRSDDFSDVATCVERTYPSLGRCLQRCGIPIEIDVIRDGDFHVVRVVSLSGESDSAATSGENESSDARAAGQRRST